MIRSSAFSVFLACAAASSSATAAPPPGLVTDGIPEISAALRAQVAPYLDSRSAAFLDWHPLRREMLISTRFGTTPQIHRVRMPAGARTQLTFSQEPVITASYRPGQGGSFVFAQDSGGNETFQLFLQDGTTGQVARLTDGKSRNTGPCWAPDGTLLAFASNARNGADADIWTVDPDHPDSRKMACQTEGGGWEALAWTADKSHLLLGEFLSAEDSRLWLADVATGKRECLTPAGPAAVARRGGVFSKDGKSIYFTSNEGSEFQQLGVMALADRKFVPLTASIPWDIESFALSPDGRTLAFSANTDGSSLLHFLTTDGSTPPTAPNLPQCVIGEIKWTADGKETGFSMTSARSPADAWSYAPGTGTLARWTESEAGGMDTATFVEPETVRVKGFDGVELSGLLYQPPACRFPGKRPVLLLAHGGPESQSRPVFQGRLNYFINELGIALLYPNIRGSTGYGKHFLSLDNGVKREDSIRDIGSFLDFVASHPGLDASHAGIMGGSYGGYVTLASMIRYADRLRGGCDIVGISNFRTFLANTAGYRRDLRRAEYGDERDPEIAGFLAAASPTAKASEIRAPLFIVQGKNDPRVPVTEAEQMVRAVRAAGSPVWYLMAPDEGHGFRKKPNADYQFLASVEFFRKYLLAGAADR